MKAYDEKYLWPIFSQFIKLRDIVPNSSGLMIKCITCGRFVPWNRAQTGHGIPRQHMATKYNETNNHAQCAKCNGFEGGRQAVYAVEVNRRYGIQTWDLLTAASKKVCKRTKADWDLMIAHYTEQVRLLKLKHHIK